MTDREKKSFDLKFELKEDMAEDDNFYYLKGYGATSDLDLGNDIITPEALQKAIEARKPKFCYQHNIKQVLGVFTTLKKDTNGLYFEAKMPKSVSICNEVAEFIKIGALDSMSIGYWVIDRDWKEGVRVIKELEIYEISVVTIPMNPNAVITGIKTLEELSTIGEIEDFLKEKGLSGNERKTIISKIKSINETDDDNDSESKEVNLSDEELKTIKYLIEKL